MTLGISESCFRNWVAQADVDEGRPEGLSSNERAELDAFSRRVVGWSIADHIRSELVVDAVQMAIWRRQAPEGQVVAHSDLGSIYTSWAFGRRLRGACLLGSMGTIGDCFDNSVAETFCGSLQLELVDEHRWTTRQQLALAIFDWTKLGTTRAAGTATARCSAPSTTNKPTRRPRRRHDHHNQPVRWIGGSSLGPSITSPCKSNTFPAPSSWPNWRPVTTRSPFRS